MWMKVKDKNMHPRTQETDNNAQKSQLMFYI